MTQVTRYKIATAVEAVDRVSRPMRNMEMATERFARNVERDFNRAEQAADRFHNSARRGGRGAGGGGLSIGSMFGIGALGLTAGGIAAASGALGVLSHNTNAATARVENLARALDMEPTALRALGHEVGAIGLDIEHVADIAEEFRNKVGEAIRLGNMTELEEGLDSIGLRMDALAKKAEKNPMGAFVDTLSALTEVSKKQGRTAAVSAADQIFSAEGNRIMGLLLANGRTWDEVLTRFERMNFLTEEGRRGATRYATAWRDTRLILGSMFEEFSGLSGDRVGGWLETFNGFVIDNKQELRTWGMAVWEVLDFTSSKFDSLNSLIEKADGPQKFFLNLLKLAGLFRAALVDVAQIWFGSWATVIEKVGAAVDWLFDKLGININEGLEMNVGQLESLVSTLDGFKASLGFGAPVAPVASMGMADTRTISEEKRFKFYESQQSRLIIEDKTGNAKLETGRPDQFQLMQTGAFAVGGPNAVGR